MYPIFRFSLGALMLLIEGVFEGLSHFQTLAFIKTTAPDFYAKISSTPCIVTWSLVATVFVVTGCFGIFKKGEGTPSSPTTLPQENRAAGGDYHERSTTLVSAPQGIAIGGSGTVTNPTVNNFRPPP